MADHFVLEHSRVRAEEHRDSLTAVGRFETTCGALADQCIEAGKWSRDRKPTLVMRLADAAEMLDEFVAGVAANANAADLPSFGAWCGPDGTLIGYGDLRTCGNGAHGFHVEGGTSAGGESPAGS